MKVAVWKIGDWLPSKFNDGKNCRVALKGLDDNKTYYLNITEIHAVKEMWIPLMKEGNVLNVSILPGTKNVNKFGRPELIKEVSKDGSE